MKTPSKPKLKSQSPKTVDKSANQKIDEASEESFPASDPPAWTTSGATQNRTPKDA